MLPVSFAIEIPALIFRHGLAVLRVADATVVPSTFTVTWALGGVVVTL
jgi:hypothetical protein